MKILKTNVMRGPNYWSNYRKKLIVLKLDLEEYKDVLSNQIAGFVYEIISLIPTLSEHHCSLGKEGGFVTRLKEGTMLGHIVEHVALELQTLAGMNCGFGRARESSVKGIYNIVFSYEVESAGLYAAKIAIKIVNTLAQQKKYSALQDNIDELKSMYDYEKLGPTTESVLQEARNKDIPYTSIDDGLFLLGQGIHQKIFSPGMSAHTSCIGVEIAGDKNLTKRLLANEFIPVPKGSFVSSLEELHDVIDHINFPLTIKPRYGNHGRGVTTNIISPDQAILAFKQAQQISSSVVVEKFINGFDYRMLVINYKLVAVAKRTPACVVGDGIHSIQELIDIINNDSKRGIRHDNILTKIEIDEITQSILLEKELALTTILPAGETLYLKYTANISTGGTATDVTDKVHHYNVFLAERIARLTNLDVCGIDLIAKTITRPLTTQNGAVLEVNAAPGFRMHLFPTKGKSRNVAKSFIDMLYPENAPSRIPIVAVTGTNGKTTVVRLMAYIAKKANYTVGMCTTEGIYIKDHEIYHGDCSGPESAAVILKNPTVDFAVLECARGGILRSGLAFDKCNVSVITNISEDHLGLNGIDTLEELTKVKSVVAHSTCETGYAVLNAEDNLVYELKNELHCAVALFSLKKNENIIQHEASGGLCCYIENNDVILADNHQLIKIVDINEIPLTYGGKSESMKQNVLAAILAARTSNIGIEIIKEALLSFFPTSENLPGRMNIFTLPNCQVMIDYAHNEGAYLSLKDYLKQISAKNKIGIIAGTGDRREIDIWKTGFYAAQIFDEIIIRHDKDPRGRTNDEITRIILSGINKIDPNKKVLVISDEFEAINHAIHHAAPGAFIWYFPDKVSSAVKYIKTKLNSLSELTIE